MMNRDIAATAVMESPWRQPGALWHKRALCAYMIVVFGHWAEHIAQAYQLFFLGWARPQAGGVLGLWFPELAAAELLHFVYNLSLLAGLLLLSPGFGGRAGTWWRMAAVFQGWHFFEHLLLQAQWLTGVYLFGAQQQTSILQLWIPRIELHLLYNTVVFIPMVIGMFWYGRSRHNAHHPRA